MIFNFWFVCSYLIICKAEFVFVKFCREFLDKVQCEIDSKPDTDCSSAGNPALLTADVGDDVIKQLFQGKLISEVSLHSTQSKQ